jgi:hypothetical protein
MRLSFAEWSEQSLRLAWHERGTSGFIVRSSVDCLARLPQPAAVSVWLYSGPSRATPIPRTHAICGTRGWIMEIRSAVANLRSYSSRKLPTRTPWWRWPARSRASGLACSRRKPANPCRSPTSSGRSWQPVNPGSFVLLVLLAQGRRQRSTIWPASCLRTWVSHFWTNPVRTPSWRRCPRVGWSTRRRTQPSESSLPPFCDWRPGARTSGSNACWRETEGSALR